jgi:hypothetical protein
MILTIVAGQFPVQVTEADVRKDHDFLRDDELGALMRRLDVLRRHSGLHLEDSKYEESEDEEDNHRAISDQWKFRKGKRQWWRRDKRKTTRQQSLRTKAIGRSLRVAKTSSGSDIRSPGTVSENALTLAAACAVSPVMTDASSPSGSSTISSASSDSIVLENTFVLSEPGQVDEQEEDLLSRGRLRTPPDTCEVSIINASTSTTDSGEHDSDFDSGACSGDKETSSNGSHLKWTQVVAADPGANDPEVEMSKEDAKPVVAKRKRIRWHSFQKRHRDSVLVKSMT